MLEWCRRAAPCAIALALAFIACEEDEVRPGLAQDCNDPACLDVRGNAVPLPVSSRPGAAGAAGGAGMPGPDAQLTGSVLEVVSPDLVTPQSLRGEVEVRGPSAAGSGDVATEPGLDGFYTLEGIQRGADVWVGVGNFTDPPVEPFIDTLQAVDTTRAGFTNLLVLQRNTLRDLAMSSFLNSSVELRLDAAHVVLQFVNDAREPIEGVQVTFPPPENVSTAYDAGDIYSDALSATSVRGMAVLLNIAAPPWPGTTLGIVADFEGEPLFAEVRIASGAVSVVSAVVPDP